MKKMNVLIFCNDRNSITKLQKLHLKYNIYVISYDISIGKSIEPMFDFIPFDSDSEMFAKETWKIIDDLNSVIKMQKIKKSAYLYESRYSIEGDMAHDIANTLYAIDIFLPIIIDKNIKIIYCDRTCNDSEIWALRELAKSKNIIFRFLSGGISSFSEFKSQVRRLYSPCLRGLINIKENFDCVSNIIKQAKSSRNDKEQNEKNYDLAFIYMLDSNKHLNWLQNNMNNFDKNLSICIFCMGSDDARKKVQNLGYNAKSVEKYFKKIHIFKNFPDYIHDVRIIAREIKKEKFAFSNIDLTKFVINLYLRKLKGEKFSFLIYEDIIKDFLDDNKTFLLTGQGSTNFISYQIFGHVIKEMEIKTKIFKDYTALETLSNEIFEYIPDVNLIDFGFFLKGNHYIDLLRKNNWKGKVYYTHNFSDYKNFKSAENKITKVNEKIQILWAPSYPFAGKYSIRSFLADNYSIIDSCKDKDVDLLIKYHPSQKDYLVSEIIEYSRNYSNINIVDKKEYISNCLKKADLVITTPSTTIIDAALKNKLVVCLADEVRYKYINYLEKGFIIIKPEELKIDKFINIVKTEEYEKVLNRQKDYIKQYFEVGANPNDILVDIISEIKEQV